MSKNKFIKKLLVAGLCALTATAMIGATACKDKGDDDGETGHVHNYATGSDWSKDAEGHWYACKNTGHTDAYTKTAHTDTNNDNKCDVCGYVLTTGGNQGGNEGGNQGGNEGGNQGGNEGGNEGGGENVTYATQKVAINISELDTGSTTANGELVAGSGIYTTSALSIGTNNKSLIYNGEPVSATKRLQLGGTGKQTEKSLKFEIANDNSVIVIYGYSGTDKTQRSLFIKDGEFQDIDGQDPQSIDSGKVNDVEYMGTAIFEVNKGIYYIGSVDSGINLYYIAIWEGGKLKEETLETKEATDATCTTPGNIAYTQTNFGRYKNASGAVVDGSTVSSPALGHAYSLDTSTLSAPGKDGSDYTEGSIKVLCNNDHSHDFVAPLPILTSDKYVKVTEGQAAGKALYGYAIPGTGTPGLTVSFVADNEATHETTYSPVYTNDFTSGTVGTDNTVEAVNGAKIYAVDQDSDASNTFTAEIADGAYHANGAKAYVTLENAITSGTVKITGNIKCASANGSWTYFQILTSDGTEFLGLRTTKSGSDMSQKVRVDGTETGTAMSFNISESYDFEILIDLDGKTVTFKIGTTTLVTNATFTKGTDLSSIMLNANSGRNAYLNSITIATADAE